MRLSARLFVLVCLLAPITAARDQCIPGPFDYDDNGQTGDDGNGDFPPFNNCFDPSCPGFQCTNNGECQNFFGPDAECVDGACITFQSCQLGQPNNDICANTGAGTCAYDASSDQPRDIGVCKPVSSTPLALGERCPLDSPDVNPCGSGGYCVPMDDDEGLCVVGCGNNGTCDDGFNCTSAYFLAGGGLPLCMPACNLDTPDCGDARLICTQAQFEGSCTPDNGACTIAGCDAVECFDLCTAGAGSAEDECADGSFCIETTISSCRIDAPTQSFAVCAPPSGQGGPCVLGEIASCENGFACGPFGFDGPRCVQQSASPASDGDACDANDPNVNRCPAGSYCARLNGGIDGVCQRFCDDDGDCDGGQSCVRANLAGFGGSNGVLDDVRVCADACAANTTCANGFLCDVDGAPCTADGACVPSESLGFCASDDDCALQTGLVCSGDHHCVVAEDICTPDDCVLTDPTTCPAGFSCSPFLSETPACVAQRDVVPDGGGCNVGDGTLTQCGAGSVCAGSVCMRACDDDAGCTAPQQCVRGNLFDGASAEDPFRFANVKLCAEPCVAFGSCPSGLTCDIDDGASCNTGAGHCLAFESGVQSCSSDLDCTDPRTVCNTSQGQCVPPQDLCTP